MSISYLQVLGIALALSVVLTKITPQHAPFSALSSNTLVLALPALAVTFVAKVLIYPFFLSPLRHLPMPKERGLLLGHFRVLLKDQLGVPLRRWIETVPNEGMIRYMFLFNVERIFLTSPKALHEVLVQKNYDFVKPRFFSSNLGRILGLGLLLAEGDEHKRQRKLLMPVFAYRHIKELYTVFWTKGCEMTELMSKLARNTPYGEKGDAAIVNVNDWASRAALDIIGIAGMGRDFNAVADPDNDLIQCYHRVLSASGGNRVLQFIAFALPEGTIESLPLRRNRDINRARAIVRKTCYDLIEAKKLKISKDGGQETDIVSVALASGGFTTEELIDQLMTFLVGGHETTATALTWAVYHLCNHPQIQTRLREEIRQHLPSASSLVDKIKASDIDELPYLNAVCNEVLRYFPSIPLTIREARVDTTILGQRIPKGTPVMISPWAINASTELWGADAHVFNPDRWLGTGRSKLGGADNNYSFLSFLQGPRSCIGQSFAKGEFACLLACWIGRFAMEFADADYQLEMLGGITNRPINMRTQIKVVDGW